MTRARPPSLRGFSAGHGPLLTMMRLVMHSIVVAAAPLIQSTLTPAGEGGEFEDPADGADLFAMYMTSAVLVLAGGAFAGLTIALMGQDGVYLQVLAGDPSEPQSKNAQRVYDLLKHGKHWVLVTLLLSNVIVNETLPVVLDRCLGGGVAAVIGSTVLIVIFGEVLPQSICVRYGLQIGGFMATPVLMLMWLMAPIAWPIAKLLDWILGEDHPTVYKKSGLKQLVNLHQTMGDVSNRLNADEVTIISAVLDLKDKPVRDVMTPMDDVFIMPDDTVLDERTMDRILSAGYSRIPIHSSGNPRNFVGMLLVKILITYDPEDCKRVSDFPLATLPETRPETSCLDIVNFFQEGKSHMVIVSACPGENHGAMGVVTLEDVIEELIGEEIIDESDVYIDVHKAIRRLTPAPKARISYNESDSKTLQNLSAPGSSRDTIVANELSHSPKPATATFMMRAPSSDGRPGLAPVAVKANLDEMRQQLKRLGPSNPATNPKDTKLASVKIKHGLRSPAIQGPNSHTHEHEFEHEHEHEHQHDADYFDDTTERTPLLNAPDASGSGSASSSRHRLLTGKGGVNAVRKAYSAHHAGESQLVSLSETIPEPTSAPTTSAIEPVLTPIPESTSKSNAVVDAANAATTTATTPAPATITPPVEIPAFSQPPHSPTDNPDASGVNVYRTGASVITESIIETDGVRKIVLHTTTSSSDEAAAPAATATATAAAAAATAAAAAGAAPSSQAPTSSSGTSAVGGEDSDETKPAEPETPKTGTVGSSNSSGKKNASKSKKKKTRRR
ncbi:hypothetical protein TD95_004003 [Thielaviopsis punctulata]|uniref:CNNM transmembrane domain-containing protein n=1 Tax=Thielaviopsis punctulata TaxID=72032 RepID=A0A0F4Z9U5_9PEZI|nr:hypothetical protein TD95_004003 [Thielaviopsis punctulata]